MYMASLTGAEMASRLPVMTTIPLDSLRLCSHRVVEKPRRAAKEQQMTTPLENIESIRAAGQGRRHKLAPGQCAYCDRERDAGVNFHPSHDASDRCESGKHPHCSCDTCF